MAGIGGGGSGSRRGENNEERLRKMVVDHLRASELFTIDTWTPEGLASLTAILEHGIPTELAYTGAKSTIRHIVSTNFARGIEWGTLSKAEQKRVINQVKGAFRNGGELDSQWIADKISNSMSQARYHDRMKIRVHLRDLNVYRNLKRPLQFSEDIWNAFY
ncbi:unnamed protein product [Sphagnum troendelagicum]|uniref:Uncharacterized protein n=1 Tax=Sphagnum troendelagicum TaxID=128251 RepID=A0ABP0UQV8_9BRYO